MWLIATFVDREIVVSCEVDNESTMVFEIVIQATTFSFLFSPFSDVTEGRVELAKLVILAGSWL